MAFQRSSLFCIKSQLSGDVLVTLAIRTVNLGLILFLPLTISNSIFREIPSRMRANFLECPGAIPFLLPDLKNVCNPYG
jgi:hypothetical protein